MHSDWRFRVFSSFSTHLAKMEMGRLRLNQSPSLSNPFPLSIKTNIWRRMKRKCIDTFLLYILDLPTRTSHPSSIHTCSPSLYRHDPQYNRTQPPFTPKKGNSLNQSSNSSRSDSLTRR